MKKTPLEHEKQYIAYLERQLASANYKAAVTTEEFVKTQAKLKKARLKLKLLK